jgi:hypothetical protein
MSTPAPRTPAGIDLEALDAITDAVESGAGLPEVVRAAARALDASLALTDRSSAVLAVAARSPADEQSLLGDAGGVEVFELRVADEPVGQLRLRSRSDADAPSPMVLRLVTTLIASEVQRVRAPARASEQAVAGFLHDLLNRRLSDRAEVQERAEGLGLDLAGGASVVVVRAQLHVPAEEGWRERVVVVVERGARAAPARRSSSCSRATTVRWPSALPTPSCASSAPGCPATPSRWAAAASLRTRATSRGRPTRRCWRPTSPRATPRGTTRIASWRSTTPAPTGCCSPP